MNKLIDLEYLTEISDGDDEFLRDLLESFVNQTPDFIRELEKAIYESDWQSAAKRAHKLKPTFEYVGLIQVREKMEYIEKTIKSDGDTTGIPELYESFKPIIEEAIAEVKTFLKTL